MPLPATIAPPTISTAMSILFSHIDHYDDNDGHRGEACRITGPALPAIGGQRAPGGPDPPKASRMGRCLRLSGRPGADQFDQPENDQ